MKEFGGPAGLIKPSRALFMTTVREYFCHGRPRKVLKEPCTAFKSPAAVIRQLWMMIPVFSLGSVLPCAVTVFCWLLIGFLT